MNQKGPRRITWLFFATLLAASVTAQTTKHEFTIQQAVEYAHRNNVQVKNALLNIESQKQTNREITAQALPNITGSGNITKYIDIPTSLLPGEVFGQPPVPISLCSSVRSTMRMRACSYSRHCSTDRYLSV